ncbi:uncharacterized protein TNCV_3337471 [Trichonephila clavipes]|nr:uncharacterized protein TNCV_3337471 [Trichonephila clavipes]
MPIMADKDILCVKFVQNSKNIIDADSGNENEMNNAASVPTLSEMKTIMKIYDLIKTESRMKRGPHRGDEAHFWLNGYVSKQNCRIWSEANPQVYVETPLHPEKLTVWCTLWAGGILLQKR